jgi:hydroxymethylpyrimidine pyrophosphatase-like HAD family hydrolase
MPNDLAAFDWVREGGGRAVAMADAHPDVLAAATDVTDSNDQDGVAAFLASLH